MAETSAIDCEGVHTRIPERHCVQCSLTQNHCSALICGVVEQKSAHIDTLWVPILRSCIRIKASANDAKDCSICLTKRVSDRID